MQNCDYENVFYSICKIINRLDLNNLNLDRGIMIIIPGGNGYIRLIFVSVADSYAKLFYYSIAFTELCQCDDMP